MTKNYIHAISKNKKIQITQIPFFLLEKGNFLYKDIPQAKIISKNIIKFITNIKMSRKNIIRKFIEEAEIWFIKIISNNYFTKFKLFWKIFINGVKYKKKLRLFSYKLHRLIIKDSLQAKILWDKIKTISLDLLWNDIKMFRKDKNITIKFIEKVKVYIWFIKIISNNYFTKFKLFWKIPIKNVKYKKLRLFKYKLFRLIRKDILQAKIILDKIIKYIQIFRKINKIKNPISIKDKIINHIMKDGRKVTSENILRKSFKTLNGDISKSVIKIFKLCVSNSMPLFKLHVSTNKKVKKQKRTVRITPHFIRKLSSRMSLGLKFILRNLKSKSPLIYSDRLVSEILINVTNNKSSLELIDDIHLQALEHKKYKKYLKNYN